MKMLDVAIVLAVTLSVVGCTPAPVFDVEPTPAVPTTHPDSRSPVAPTAPANLSASAMVEGFGFVTVEDDEYGLAPPPESTARLIVWAEHYCEKEGLSPCAGIAGRATRLCIEKWDCHPALLVPFMQGTAAFLTGGIFPQPQIIAVWRPESDPGLARYGGARKLLEAYLLTVGVCPNTGDGSPRGETCPRMEEGD